MHSFYWEELTCELCKFGLNIAQIAKRDRRTIYYLLGIKKVSNRRYMILESDIECLSKAIHVIDFSIKNVFNVGRRVTNDITVSDISVSRKQSEIELDLDTNQLFLTDCYSKFGTFVRIDGLHPVDRMGDTIPVQIEKKCFFITLRDRYSPSERCVICLCPSRGGKEKDHYCDVSQKFPLEIKKQLMPVQFELDRQRLKQALREKKERMDELTQIAQRQALIQGEVTQEVDVSDSPPRRASVDDRDPLTVTVLPPGRNQDRLDGRPDVQEEQMLSLEGRNADDLAFESDEESVEESYEEEAEEDDEADGAAGEAPHEGQ